MNNNSNKENRVRLELIGITYNQIESGVYALVLQEKGGKRRIPIIIGYPEAQAIECKLQEVVTPRPLTHDLMVSIMATFGISLKEVEIYRMTNGVFAADMHLADEKSTHIVDARSSDAISLAIRVGAPIYTSRELLEQAGFSPENEQENADALTPETPATTLDSYTNIPDKTLKSMMDTAVANEDYETAALIKQEFDRRRQTGAENKESE